MRTARIGIIVLLAFVMAGCATFQEKWNGLSDQERARVIVGGVQKQLADLFAAGKAYVAANPDKAEQWKAKVVPAFDTANKAVAAYIVIIGQGQATPETAIKALFPLIKAVTDLLKGLGVDLSETYASIAIKANGGAE